MLQAVGVKKGEMSERWSDASKMLWRQGSPSVGLRETVVTLCAIVASLGYLGGQSLMCGLSSEKCGPR